MVNDSFFGGKGEKGSMGWSAMGVRSKVMLWLVLCLVFVSSGSGLFTCTNTLLRDFPMGLQGGNIAGTKSTILVADGVPTRHTLELTASGEANSKYCFGFKFISPSGSDPLTSHEVSLRGTGVSSADAKRISTTDQSVCLDQIPNRWSNCCSRGIRIEGRAENGRGEVFTGNLFVRLRCPVPRRQQKFVINSRTGYYRNKFVDDDQEELIDMDFHTLTRVVVTQRRGSGLQDARFYKRNGAGDWVLRQTKSDTAIWRVYVKWGTVVMLTIFKRIKIFQETSPGNWQLRVKAPTMYSRFGAAVQGSRVAALTSPNEVTVWVRSGTRWSTGAVVQLRSSMDVGKYERSNFEPLTFNEDGSLIVLNMKDYIRNSSTRISAELYIDQGGFRRAQVWDSGDGRTGEIFGNGGTVYAKGKFLFISGANGITHPVWDVFVKNARGRYDFLQKLSPAHSEFPKRSLEYYPAQIYATETHVVVNDAFIMEPSGQPWKTWQTAAVYKLSSVGLWKPRANLRRSDRPIGQMGVLRLWRLRTVKLIIDGQFVVAVMQDPVKKEIYSWGRFA